jgi:hypothetical protein
MPTRHHFLSLLATILISLIALTQCLMASTSKGLNFAPVVNYAPGGIGAFSVAVADVNGDGKPDLVVANECSVAGTCGPNGTVGVLLGNGDGTFQTPVAYPSGGYQSRSVAVADVNGDGKPDIVVSSLQCAATANSCGPNGVVGVLLGNGDGTFQPVVTYDTGGEYALTVVVADVNGDGKPDLIVANANSVNIGVLLGNGDGTFQAAVTYGSGGIGDTNSVAVADVDGDGRPDLVTVNVTGSSANGSVGVLLGNGDGTFQKAITYSSGGQGPFAVAIADLNGDGKPDLAVTNCGDDCGAADGSVAVLLGNGDGTFQTPVAYDSGGGEPNSVVVSDVNGDGKPDLLCANNGNVGTVAVLIGNGDGTFQKALTYNSGAAGGGGSAATSLAVADLNGDGKPDLLVASLAETVGVLINTSMGPTSTALTSSVNPSKFEEAVTFTATVTAQPFFDKGPPTGTVSFYCGTTSIGTSDLNSSGVATLTISTLAVGTHSITAKYSGSTDFVSSTSPVRHQIVQGAVASVSPTSLSYGNQTVGIASATKSVTLTNRGNIDLTISSIFISGTDRGDFAQSNNCPSSLAPGRSCTTSVTFKPTATGARAAALSITDDAHNSPQKISLTGVGVSPEVAFLPTTASPGP